MTVEQVAERLQVSAWTVRKWLRTGALEGSYLSDRAGWRIPESAVARFMEERSNRPHDDHPTVDDGTKGKAAA